MTVFADPAGTAVRNGNLLLHDIRGIRSRYDDALAELRADSAARAVAGLLFEHPVVNVRLVQDRLGIVDQTAYRSFVALENRGVLTAGKSWKRNRVWVAVHITVALHRFAERAGRRDAVAVG